MCCMKAKPRFAHQGGAQQVGIAAFSSVAMAPAKGEPSPLVVDYRVVIQKLDVVPCGRAPG